MAASVKCLCCLLLVVFVGGNEARQIRINRYETEVQNDQAAPDEIVATVEEINPRGYPASGNRPGRAFNLPDDAQSPTTTTIPVEYDTTTTTSWLSDANEVAATTMETPAEQQTGDAANTKGARKAPYPAAGYRPSKAFPLPSEIEAQSRAVSGDTATDTPLAPFTTTAAVGVEESTTTDIVDATTTLARATTVAPALRRRAPYPAAGFRPRRPFLLPTELEAAPSSSSDSKILVDDEAEPDAKPIDSNDDVSKHPVCGVSLNPLAPKPAKGAKDDPDAERVLITATPLAPAVISVPAARLLALRSQPLVLARTQAFLGQPLVFDAAAQRW